MSKVKNIIELYKEFNQLLEEDEEISIKKTDIPLLVLASVILESVEGHGKKALKAHKGEIEDKEKDRKHQIFNSMYGKVKG